MAGARCCLGKYHTEAASVFSRQPLPLLLFFSVVVEVERLRLNDAGAHFYTAFSYLELNDLREASLHDVTIAVVQELFDLHLEALKAWASHREKLALIEDLAIFLLVAFNHRFAEIRPLADKFLTTLTRFFPHVVWSDRVLSAALDLLDELHQRLDPFVVVGLRQEVQLPYPPFRYIFPSLLHERQGILKGSQAGWVACLLSFSAGA
jgi:hypothetical protein